MVTWVKIRDRTDRRHMIGTGRFMTFFSPFPPESNSYQGGRAVPMFVSAEGNSSLLSKPPNCRNIINFVLNHHWRYEILTTK